MIGFRFLLCCSIGLMLLSVPRWEAVRAGELTTPPRPSFVPEGVPFEIDRADPSWCGPRVLYFFARYYGKEITLESAINLCKTDRQGYTSLLNLHESLRHLDLEPEAIACDADHLRTLSGPAIICVQRSDAPTNDGRRAPQSTAQGPLHFIGIVAKHGSDEYWVIDPAVDPHPFLVASVRIARAYSGQAILLRGCLRPALRPSCLTLCWLLGSGVVAGFFVFGVIHQFRKHSQPPSISQGETPC